MSNYQRIMISPDWWISSPKVVEYEVQDWDTWMVMIVMLASGQILLINILLIQLDGTVSPDGDFKSTKVVQCIAI